MTEKSSPQPTTPQEVPTFTQIITKSAKAGVAGASAMAIQVTSLMWMRTTMNYQFKNGGGFILTLKTLYSEGGIVRFYRGILPALIIGPISRFGDTAANMLATTTFKSHPELKNLPIFIQTSLGSVLAGFWRLSTLPVDAWKTSKQVYGPEGLNVLLTKFRANGISAFYQGGIASALATMVGHYPWFVTNNYLEHYLPKYSYNTDFGMAILRSAGIGFLCTVVSDCISNSIRVVKTFKQTAKEKLTYKQVISQIVEKDGVSGLLLRGLQTKLLTNVIQGMAFSVAWKYIQHTIEEKERRK